MTTLKQFAIELPVIRDEAKALWGDGEIRTEGYKISLRNFGYPRTPDWRSHLKAMIESDDPVTYLKENTPK